MPLYLERSFRASYTMVTLIPVVFGVGKWLASLPSGYLMDRLGRRFLMGFGSLLIAAIDLSSVATADYRLFLLLRAVGGAGWAMFATVATTITVGVGAPERRGRAVSLLLMSETVGLLLGSTLGGWLYQVVGIRSPFFLEAACMLVAAVVVARTVLPVSALVSAGARHSHDRHALGNVLRTPGVVLMGLTSAVLISIQTGVLVFLLPLYLVSQRHLEPTTVGILVSLMVLGRLTALWFGGRASDQHGRMRVLAPGLLVYGVILGNLTLLTGTLALAVWSVAVGAAAGLVMPLSTALVGDRVSPRLHGVAVGWLRTMTDTGHILGALLMGALADAVGVATPFFCGAGMLLFVACLCYRHAAACRAS